MGYSENELGEVILTMTRDDYDALLLRLGYAAGAALREGKLDVFRQTLALANRLNEGNARYTPYEVSEENGEAKC